MEDVAEYRCADARRVAREAHENFAVLLNDVLEHSSLLPPLPNHVDDNDLQRTFAVPSHNSIASHESEMSMTLSESYNREVRLARVSRSAEVREASTQGRKASRSDLEEYIEAVREFNKAQDDFESREQDRDKEAEDFLRQRRSSNPPSETPASFHVRQVQRGRELTRQLIEAEEACRTAKARALQAGIDLHSKNLSSGFADRDSDGGDSGPGQTHVIQDKMHPSKLEQWLDELPEDNYEAEGAEKRPADADVWDWHSLALWESESALDDVSHRRRIDRWRQLGEEYRSRNSGLYDRSEDSSFS